MPPNAFHVGADAFYDTSLGGTGLTYDTAHLIPLDALLGSQSISTQTPRSFTFLKTHSYSVSLARHILWNQVLDVAYVGTTGRDLGSLSTRMSCRWVASAVGSWAMPTCRSR